MRLTSSRPALSLSVLFVATLAACGGGGGSDAPAATSVTITGKAVDGPLQGAIACYDLNDNGSCDNGEPTSNPSDADGNFSFSVDTAVAGRHRVVVDVPATAIDKDTGAAVGTAFTLQAPATSSASASVFVSPLTTLVQAQIDTTGATLTAATEFIQSQAGLSVSPLADFTTASTAENRQAANVARLIVLTTQQQTAAVSGVVGTADISGSAITAADLNKAITQAVIAALPTVAATAADPAVANATGEALQTALTAAAQTVVSQTGLTADSAAAAVGVAKLPADTSVETPVAGATLSALRYTNANDWYVRTLEASAADNTPDANGRVRYYESRKLSSSSNFSSNGTVQSWARNNTPERAGDLHWNGTAWVGCLLGDRYSGTVRDAQGRSTYEYCNGFEEGSSTRNAVDLSGQSIATVFTNTIKAFPGGAGGVAYADWGPSDVSVFGSATFPTGSKLFYQTNTVTKTAIGYDVRTVNEVRVFSADVAAGGDARANASLACAAANVTDAPVTTLEDMVARNPGVPCVFNRGGTAPDVSLESNEWWSNSTASLGVLTGAATRPDGTGAWYSTDLRLRVAFTPGSTSTTYYQCFSRASNGSTRNCTAIGTGSYAIQTLGDARVMTFTGIPASAQRLGYARVFVERGGKVYFGYQNAKGQVSNLLRLNLEAMNAVFAPLGLPPVAPITRPADFSTAKTEAANALRGVWGKADDTSAVVLRFADGGRFLLGEADAPDTSPGQSGTELGLFDYDPANGSLKTVREVDTNLTWGTSHPQAGDTLAVTATQLTFDGTEVINRLTTGTSAELTGLWAVGSATNLKTQHFAFFPNGRVLIIDPLGDTSGGTCTTNRQGPAGAEYAQYTFDAATGAVRVFGLIYDTNGCAGFFDSVTGGSGTVTSNTEFNMTVVFSNNGAVGTFTEGATEGGNSYTLYRIPAQ